MTPFYESGYILGLLLFMATIHSCIGTPHFSLFFFAILNSRSGSWQRLSGGYEALGATGEGFGGRRSSNLSKISSSSQLLSGVDGEGAKDAPIAFVAIVTFDLK